MTYIHNWPNSDLEFYHLVPIDTSRFLFRIFLFLFVYLFVCLFFSFSSKVASMNAMAILISILDIFFDKSIEMSLKA